MDKNKLNLGRTLQSHLGRKIHKKHLHVPPSTRCNLQFISEEKHSKSGKTASFEKPKPINTRENQVLCLLVSATVIFFF